MLIDSGCIVSMLALYLTGHVPPEIETQIEKHAESCRDVAALNIAVFLTGSYIV